MPSSKKPLFKPPSNPRIKIWRYMDFTKYVSLLEDESLFFCRGDFFEDPFEGSYTKLNKEIAAIEWGILSVGTSDIYKRIRQWTLINCWHMNEHESAAMWRLYAKTNEAICIQSTYERLRQCLDERTYIGEVKYIDYNTDAIPEYDSVSAFLHKRKSFEHEREVRAIIQELPTRENYDAAPPDSGVSKKVNLDQLIEAIYTAPSSPVWFHRLVKKVVAKYGLNKQVIQSSLDDEPIF
jgi:hypothetical protein